jgi:hypothetical protein
MSINLRDLVLHPNTFFAGISYERKHFFVPVAIVAFMGFMGVMDFLLFATRYTLDFSNVGFPPEAVLGQMAFPFILWVFVTLVLFAIARAFSGSGSLPATFQNIGFGMFPLAIAAVVGLLFSVMVQGRTIDMISVALLALIMWVFSVWSWYLLCCSTRHTHTIPWGKAAVAVGVVVLFQFGVQYWLYVTGF